MIQIEVLFLFPKLYDIHSAHVYEIYLKLERCHWNEETGVFQFILRYFPPRPKVPLDNVMLS